MILDHFNRDRVPFRKRTVQFRRTQQVVEATELDPANDCDGWGNVNQHFDDTAPPVHVGGMVVDTGGFSATVMRLSGRCPSLEE